MRFKIDENLPVEVAELLRRLGHDATTILEQHLGGSADPKVASVCQQERRILVTLDLDFADIRVYPPEEFSGLIVLRLRRQDKIHVLKVVTRLMEMSFRESPDKHLWIVEEERVRIRK